MQVVKETAIPGLHMAVQDDIHDIYALPQEKQLVIHTDRMAVAGQVLDKPIPYRGVMFSQITLYWVNRFNNTRLVGNNLVVQAVERFPQEFQPYAAMLKGRSVITQKLKRLPLSFRVVGNLIGDEWKKYQETRMVAGKPLPKGMKEADRLENPIMVIVPTGDLVKQGIDDLNKWAQRMYGPMLYKNLEDICLSIFAVTRGYAARRGMLIADTHFEFGLHEGTPYIINDVMTPDTSTYWYADDYVRGQIPPSLDRQPVLDWLASEGWKKSQPLPEIPQDVITETSRRYRAIFDVMTGKVALPEKEDQAAM